MSYMPTPFSGKNYQKNADKCMGDAVPCAVCGTQINNLDAVRWINVIVGGEQFGPPDADPNDAGFMGAFPIGPSCWAKWGRKAFYVWAIRRIEET